MKVLVHEEFTYAVNGYNITKFQPSDEAQDIDEAAAKYGIKIGHAEPADAEAKALAKSPENKSRKGK